MIVIKLWYHFIAFIQKIFLHILYGRNFKVGKKTTWRRGFSVMKASSAKIEIGENCFFNNNCSVNGNHIIKIGNGTLFGENVKIYDHNHRFSLHQAIKEQGFSDGSVIIGKQCWIGSNVTILKGANIGDNCVIGAGCVVSGKVPSNSVMKLKQNVIIESILYKDKE